ncbi:hypothetical protein H8L32_08645 [Undibacterium sp. CY18W]|uniref:Uncharacterized protein n=1 Tax=Undibacterium hunanense TaxID=2762292 RepID=A0ABR6ZNQ8_9BURK|nr:hypothetical protein [Undibacterium hunanense]MBC3917536.1 hypothetical protein [Undibacterium hunanense]
MKKISVVFKSIFFGAMFICCSTHSAELIPFSANDEWIFIQKISQAGRPDISNEIKFITPFKNDNGENVIFLAKAAKDIGQVIWQPVARLAASICVQDFVGKTDLGLTNSCSKGLKTGSEWQVKIDYKSAQDQIKYIVGSDEIVKVPAGTYHAIKIQGVGTHKSLNESPENITVAYWFSPEVKAMVQTIREYRSADGKLLSTITEELKEVKVNASLASPLP